MQSNCIKNAKCSISVSFILRKLSTIVKNKRNCTAEEKNVQSFVIFTHHPNKYEEK